ncbi:MAG TPA: site-specific integrase [Candidatus Bathyarchaeia archaeon]|nr:site-specific integrase [Candidatus Bathyarchaeia archaeon]HLE86648.1 site-specific integrase [Candidatus Brocadiaceae bacterium]
MLTQLFPKTFKQYSSLPLLGSIADDFSKRLLQQGYQEGSVCNQLRTIIRIDKSLRQCGVKRLEEITRESLHAFLPAKSQDDRLLAGTIRALERFLYEKRLLSSPKDDPPSRTGMLLLLYTAYLKEVRAFADSTISHHRFTTSQFLDHLNYESNPYSLSTLNSVNVEKFVRTSGVKYSRGTLQHIVANVRGFLRFLSTKGIIAHGLDTQIDTSRVYRLEQLPHSLPWDKVCALLSSIDQTTSMGLRDYTMLFLIATYGLRTCEIVTLTLDDIHWREGWIQIPQRKTDSCLALPLTDEAGTVLLKYLKHGRPSLPYRELFLRVRAPAGRLKPAAVTEVFQGCVRRSGIDIKFQGPHCIRHSFAVHLLRQGTSLKVIGDLLGHRSAESTCVYLRLATDDLRDVALPLPQENINQ